jgi:hypothetical protein
MSTYVPEVYVGSAIEVSTDIALCALLSKASGFQEADKVPPEHEFGTVRSNAYHPSKQQYVWELHKSRTRASGVDTTHVLPEY